MRLAVVALLSLAPLSATAQVTGADSLFVHEVKYRAQLDQAVRHLPDARYPAAPVDSMDANTASLWLTVDLLNAAWARGVVAERGWPKKSDVGARAAVEFFILVQHADLPTQQAMLPLMEAAVAEGEADGSELAYLADRVRMREGRPQLYGTQYRMVDGEPVFHTIEDETDVDARRAAVGLGTLELYRAQILNPHLDHGPHD